MNPITGRIFPGATLLVTCFWAFAGFAQGPSCSCVTSLGGPSGKIVAASGSVLSSQASGLKPAGVGARIGAETQIITGRGAAAQIAIGGCKVTMAENTEAILRPSGGDICIELTQIAVPPANSFPAVIGAGGVAAMLGGAILEKWHSNSTGGLSRRPPLGEGPSVSR